MSCSPGRGGEACRRSPRGRPRGCSLGPLGSSVARQWGSWLTEAVRSPHVSVENTIDYDELL